MLSGSVVASLLLVLAQTPEQKDQQAKARLDGFKKELRTCKTDTDVCRALVTLGEVQHPKVLAELKVWLSKPSAELASAAAEQMARYKNDKDAAETLVAAAGNRKDTSTAVKFLRYAGDVGYKGVVPRLLNFMSNKDTDLAAEAVDSLGRIRSKDAIDRLINLARELEAVRDDTRETGGVGNVGAPALPGGGIAGANTAADRKKKLLPVVYNALCNITNERHSTLKDWETWWRKNKSTFKDPQ